MLSESEIADLDHWLQGMIERGFYVSAGWRAEVEPADNEPSYIKYGFPFDEAIYPELFNGSDEKEV